jgi:ribosomal protein S18 acetylase RimI-like enzyme
MVGVTIRTATAEDKAQVAALWRACGLVIPTNDPDADFQLAAGKSNSEILVAQDVAQRLVGAIMVGHDGHRGWVYYVAVDPGCRKQGVGRTLMQTAETWLRQRGIPKLNLMVRETNAQAAKFYQQLGYEITPRITLQKVLKAPS